MTIGLCTDSSAQLPAELAHRFQIAVVPLTVAIDGCDYLEGVDLDSDGFAAMFTNGHCPVVATSEPSPGQFAVAYDDLAARGCDQIVSIHSSAAASGTLSAARLGAHAASVPVRLVDSGTVGIEVSCCVWAAAEAVAAGASIDDVVHLVETLSPSIGNVFVVGAIELLRASGGEQIPVLTYRDGRTHLVGRVTSAQAAADLMAATIGGWGSDLHVALGVADRRTAPLTDAVHAAVVANEGVIDLVHHRVSPSAVAQAGPRSVGPGFVGAVAFPITT